MKVTLKVNSWHVKLQKWTFGNASLRKNLCPHFWLTIFCIIVSPIMLVLKTLGAIGLFVIERAADVTESFQRSWQARKDESITRTAREFSLYDAYRVWNLLKEYEQLADNIENHYTGRVARHPLFDVTLRRKYRELLTRWKGMNPDWEQMFADHRKSLDEQWEEYERQLKADRDKDEKRRLRAEAIFNRIAETTRWIVKGIALGLAAALVLLTLGGAASAVYWFVMHFGQIPWTMVIGWSFVVVGEALVIAFVCVADTEWMDRRPSSRPVKDPGLFELYFRAAKENYCPKIEWDE